MIRALLFLAIIAAPLLYMSDAMDRARADIRKAYEVQE